MKNNKRWEDFTKEEKTTLLEHWFYYYGGLIMTLKDLEDFREISSTRQDEIFAHIVTNYIFRNTIKSNMLLTFLREDKIDELLNASLSIDNFSEDKRNIYEEIRIIISNELLNTFINPEPSVPMDLEVIITDNGPTKHM